MPKKWNYYNEHDPKAAAWIRELIKKGLVGDGEVDERSIEDVQPDDVRGFVQAHWFAGIAVWSYALRRAGWPDDRPVWTGSCPCQPFSAAGKAGGFADERHLWPAFFHLVRQCRPATVFGEQVASKDGLAWLDLVHADLEGEGYSVGALDLCAAGFGAPHIRQRIFFVGDMAHSASGVGGFRGTRQLAESESEQLDRSGHARRGWRELANGSVSGVAQGDTEPTRLEGHGGDVGNGNQPGRLGAYAAGSVAEAGAVDDLADAKNSGRFTGADRQLGGSEFSGQSEEPESRGDTQALEHCRPVNGFWHPADWLPCRDGKWRPVEPGTFPLAHGAPARVGRLRGYGNAIVAPVAKGFIEAYLDVTP